MSSTKIDHTNTICHICKSDRTGKNFAGNPHWIRYKDKNGKWDRKSYICIRCYDCIRKHRKERDAAKRKDLEQRKCCICGNNFTYIYEGDPTWHRHICDKESCTRWLCHKCYTRERSKLPDSHNNVRKHIRNVRTGNLDKDGETGKGLLIECVIAKVRKLKNMNVEMDNFNYKFDVSIDIELGIIQIKSKARDTTNRQWTFDYNKDQEFDHILLVCLDKKRENIERIYIIPRKFAIRRSGITILQDQIRDTWYEEFRMDEKSKKYYNDVYHDLMEFLKNKKYFGIEDVKKWLNEEKVLKGDENMCFVDAGSSNIDIEQSGLEPIQYKCMDCKSTFKAIGKRVKCPTCESAHVEKK